MTETDTIRRVARPRGVLSIKTREKIAEAKDELERSQDWYRDVVVTALREGSFSAVAEATGLSKDTLQRWKREAGK